MNKNLIAILLLVSTFACGGQIDSTGDAQALESPPAFEPFTMYATAKDHAAKYCSNPSAYGLSGELSVDRTRYGWSWRFHCDAQIFVTVAVSPNRARVTGHGLGPLHCGDTFDPGKVVVQATNLLAIVKKRGISLPDEMDLGKALAPNSSPEWSVTAGKASLSIDAMSGNIDG